MKTSIVLTLAIALVAPVVAIAPASAGNTSGTSPLGSNPDQRITIAEREHFRRLRAQGKTKTLFPTTRQQLIGEEEDKWFMRQLRTNPEFQRRYLKDR